MLVINFIGSRVLDTGYWVLGTRYWAKGNTLKSIHINFTCHESWCNYYFGIEPVYYTFVWDSITGKASCQIKSIIRKSMVVNDLEKRKLNMDK